MERERRDGVEESVLTNVGRGKQIGQRGERVVGKNCKLPQDAGTRLAAFCFSALRSPRFSQPAHAWPRHTHATAPRPSAASWLRARRLALPFPPVSMRELATCPSRAAKRQRQSVADRQLTLHRCRHANKPQLNLWMAMSKCAIPDNQRRTSKRVLKIAALLSLIHSFHSCENSRLCSSTRIPALIFNAKPLELTATVPPDG